MVLEKQTSVVVRRYEEKMCGQLFLHTPGSQSFLYVLTILLTISLFVIFVRALWIMRFDLCLALTMHCVLYVGMSFALQFQSLPDL